MTIWAEDDTSTGSRFTSIAHIISRVLCRVTRRSVQKVSV